MSNLSWDSNTWYSVQNFGSDWFLAAGDVKDGSGSVTVAEASTADNAVWQIGTSSGTHYLRPKEKGAAYCMVSSGTNLSLTSCSSNSSVWDIATWNARDAGDGNFFTSRTSDNDSRLYVNTEGTDISMKKYSNSDSNNAIFYQWAIASVSAINDEAYSSFPNSGSGSGSISSTPSSSSSSTSSGGSSSASSSSNVEPSTSTNFVTVTGSGGSSSAISGASGTSTMVITATPSSPPSSSPTSPTGPASVGLNGARANYDSSKSAMLVLALGLGALLNTGFI